jgi:hypothetical protein
LTHPHMDDFFERIHASRGSLAPDMFLVVHENNENCLWRVTCHRLTKHIIQRRL